MRHLSLSIRILANFAKTRARRKCRPYSQLKLLALGAGSAVLCCPQGFEMHDSFGTGFGIFIGLICFVVVCVILGITIRACIDYAHRRGKSPALVSIAVILSFALGMIDWLLFRPEPLDRVGGHPPFRLDKHRLQ